MRKRKFSDAISGKGYYIALVLCAVAIGVSGFLYYRNADKTDKDINADVPTASQPLDDQQVAIPALIPPRISEVRLSPTIIAFALSKPGMRAKQFSK